MLHPGNSRSGRMLRLGNMRKGVEQTREVYYIAFARLSKRGRIGKYGSLQDARTLRIPSACPMVR